MSIAFHGDATLQSQLLARFDGHCADGTLVIGDTRWDGQRGSPLGVLAHDTSIDALATLTGYPLALCGLLDPLAAIIRDVDAAARFGRQWVAAASPGADLASVPGWIVVDLLDRLDPALADPALVAAVSGLHRHALAGESLPRLEWSALRAAIMSRGDAESDEARRAAWHMLEAAVWPADGSRSILATMIASWCDLAAWEDGGDWTISDEDRAQAVLKQLWDAHHASGGAPSYPALFAERDPVLARRFEANLQRVNRRHLARIDDAVTLVLARIAGARA